MMNESTVLDTMVKDYESTVLIVDDIPAGCKVLEALLQNQGYRLAFASNGLEALEQATRLMPDLILLDVMMPGMDGFEVCRRLRRDPVLAEVPVIMVTALDDAESRIYGIQSGADDFISKPFDRAELRARVHTITRLNRYRRLLLERTRFEWVIENADDGYLMVDLEDTITYANPQARRYLGLPHDRHSPLTETFRSLVEKQYRCEPNAAWDNWPRQYHRAVPLYLVLPESDQTRPIWLHVDILDSAPGMGVGTGAGRLIRLRDVTTRMELQRDMRSFHAMVYHKLRTPMVSLLGGLDLLTRQAAKASETVAEIARISLIGAQRLQTTIQDILQYLETPSLARNDLGFELAQLPTVVATIGADLKLKPVLLATQEMPLWSMKTVLSQRAMELILWEVLENARKFHPHNNPTIEVTISCAGEQGVRLCIVDDGLTLSPEQLAHAWTPYYQGEKEFTGELPGMGPGLAMVSAILWEVNGTCSISNRPDGSGVLVELVIPTTHADAETADSLMRERILAAPPQ